MIPTGWTILPTLFPPRYKPSVEVIGAVVYHDETEMNALVPHWLAAVQAPDERPESRIGKRQVKTNAEISTRNLSFKLK
jgi:hypothetical protein